MGSVSQRRSLVRPSRFHISACTCIPRGGDVGSIDKHDLERLRGRSVEVSFRCPYCGGTRIIMKGRGATDYWQGTECKKCGSKVVLDSLTVLVIRENGNGQPAMGNAEQVIV